MLKTLLRSRWSLWALVALVSAVAAVYGQVVHFQFVNYDDPFLIGNNPIVRAGLTVQGIFWAMTSRYYGFWSPLAWISHMLDVSLFGPYAGGHHLTSVVLHLASSLILFGVLHRATGSRERSAIVAGLFALHPLHVESVAWISERRDVLSALFYLLTIGAYIEYTAYRGGDHGSPAPEGQPDRNSTLWYRIALTAFAAALMAKVMVITLPFVLLLLDLWPLGRFSLSAPVNLRKIIPLVREKLPFFVMAGIGYWLGFSSMNVNGWIASPVQRVPWANRLATIPVNYAQYVGKMLWPANLAAHYPANWHWSTWVVALAATLVLSVSVISVMKLRSRPYLAVGWFAFLGGLVPVIGFFPLGHFSIADRYMYLPSIGLSIAVVWAVADWSVNWNVPLVVRRASATLVLLACGYGSWRQTGYWHDSVRLWERCVSVTANNSLAYYNLGSAQLDAKQPEPAMIQFRKALKLNPAYLDATMNLGACYLMLTNLPEATNWFAKALELKPDYWKAHENMGIALLDLGDLRRAEEHLSAAIKLNPTSVQAIFRLGQIWSAEGRIAEAFANYNEALQLAPDSDEVNCYYGVECIKQGMVSEGLSRINRAVELNPNWPEGRLQLALALTEHGIPVSAIEQYREALRLKPDFSVALNNLAWLLATSPDGSLRNGAEAVGLAKHACELTQYRQPVFLGTLGAAYAEVGDFVSAQKAAQQACECASELRLTNVLQRNQDLLKLYQGRQTARGN